ncbi:MAG: glucokinase [candidate division Zixibacteria bacterium]|nr:glucokinase [candidate division Zixibacteria bacterium]
MTARIAGYISGNTVEIAKVREKKSQIELYEIESYNSKQFSNFKAILNLYLKHNTDKLSKACFGVAGPVIQNQVDTTNLPWHIIGEKIESDFSFKRVKLVNDIVATAHGLSQLGADKFFTINRGRKGENGNIGLIAAGTGLGEALIYSDGTRAYPYASEGGHADFAPGNQLEAELWAYLYSEQGHVEVEDIVSLSGLERIFNFLAENHGWKKTKWYEESSDRPSDILETALQGKDQKAVETLDVFIDCYASEAANLALKGMTLGGIYIGGLIAPQIITALDKGRFMERFVKKGKMESLLAKMPVGIIIEEKTPLQGAARIALDL